MPTGISVGLNKVRPSKSASMVKHAPAKAEGTIGTVRGPAKRRPNSGAAKPIMPTGPATATARPVKLPANKIVKKRKRLTRTPKLWATASGKRTKLRRLPTIAASGSNITTPQASKLTVIPERSFKLPIVQGKASLAASIGARASIKLVAAPQIAPKPSPVIKKR